MNFVFITINVEHVKFSFPFVCDFGDRYYSNLKKKKNKLWENKKEMCIQAEEQFFENKYE